MSAKRKPAAIEVVENPIVISWSEINTFRQCPFKHHLEYRERWRSDEEKEALARGTLWHEVLELHYQGRMQKGVSRFRAEIEELCGVHEPVPTERQELIAWMYEGYAQYWKAEDKEWQIQAVEWKGYAPLPNPTGEPSRFILKVKIDLLAAQRGRLWVWDHKSGRNLPSDRELDLDDQFGLYIWCMRQLGYPVAGAVYNAARTQRNKSTPQTLEDRFSRTRLSRTDVELDTIAAEAYTTAEKAWPVEQIERVPERNPDTDQCRWKCSFTEACLSSRKGGRLEDMLKAHHYERHPFREVELEYKAHLEANS